MSINCPKHAESDDKPSKISTKEIMRSAKSVHKSRLENVGFFHLIDFAYQKLKTAFPKLRAFVA